DPNNPYGQQPQNPQKSQGAQNNPYGQQPPPGYGYPQQPAQPAPGYGYPQGGQSPYGAPNAGAYGFPGVAGARAAGSVDVPGRGPTLLANGGQRAGARIIDTVIVYAVIIVLYIAFGVGLHVASSGGSGTSGGVAVGGLII